MPHLKEVRNRILPDCFRLFIDLRKQIVGKLFLFVLFFIFINKVALSQFYYPCVFFSKDSAIIAAKKSKCYVLVFDTTSEKASFLEAGQYNVYIRKAVSNYWKDMNVEFKTYADLQKVTDKSASFVLFPTEIATTKSSLSKNGVKLNGVYSSFSNSYLKLAATSALYKVNKLFGNNYVVDVSKYNLLEGINGFNYVSLARAVNGMYLCMHYKSSDKAGKDSYTNTSTNNYKKLREKTLLLDKELLDKKVTEEKIREVYPYPFKIVSFEEIVKSVELSEVDKAFVEIRQNGEQVLFSCVDSIELMYLSFFYKGDFGLEIGDMKKLSKIVSKEK